MGGNIHITRRMQAVQLAQQMKTADDRKRLGEGVGTELKEMLAKFGVRPAPGCRCSEYAARMNQEGTEWCRKHIGTILAWLKTESIRRGLPFVKPVVKLVVLRAIRLTEAKERTTNHGQATSN